MDRPATRCGGWYDVVVGGVTNRHGVLRSRCCRVRGPGSCRWREVPVRWLVTLSLVLATDGLLVGRVGTARDLGFGTPRLLGGWRLRLRGSWGWRRALGGWGCGEVGGLLGAGLRGVLRRHHRAVVLQVVVLLVTMHSLGDLTVTFLSRDGLGGPLGVPLV